MIVKRKHYPCNNIGQLGLEGLRRGKYHPDRHSEQSPG